MILAGICAWSCATLLLLLLIYLIDMHPESNNREMCEKEMVKPKNLQGFSPSTNLLFEEQVEFQLTKISFGWLPPYQVL